MERNDWKFTYPAEKLAQAAKDKQWWHSGRLEFWNQKQENVKKKIREEGIEVDESMAFRSGTLNNDYNAVRGAVASIRNDLLKDLQETTSKVIEHRSKVREYDSWRQVMEAQAGHSYQLEQDDWMFFFGK